ncbi:MAG: phosphatidate cytidylyltransferase [Oscillospiraceae bacterium]
MKTRIISALIGLPIAFFAVWQFNSIILNILGVGVFSIAIYEISNAFKEDSTKWCAPLLFALGVVVLMRPYIMISPMQALAAFIFFTALIVVLQFNKIQFKSVAAGLLFGVFVLFGLYSVSRLKIIMPFDTFGWDGAFLFVLSGAIAWGGDVMAYFTGVFMGKHKLAPNLSPKKTIEGAVGGVVGSIFFAILMLYIYSYLKPWAENSGIVYVITGSKILMVSLVAAIGSCIGIIGDLFASAIKRQCGIKDYGYIMPGHGGMLDRFDSILLVSPFISVIGDFLVINGGIF